MVKIQSQWRRYLAKDVKRKLVFAKKWEEAKTELFKAYNKPKDKKHQQATRALRGITEEQKNKAIERYYIPAKKLYLVSFSKWFHKVRGLKKPSKETVVPGNKEEEKPPVFVYCPEGKELDELILKTARIIA